ncbi:MAG: hypothetical protein IJ733_19630 [Lachnospiraceae bacterium]|nr:hypothetical protein [Lachnospiraceae bacterium]
MNEYIIQFLTAGYGKEEEIAMASISGANIINYDYLLRNCYSSNRYARKGASRATYGSTELLSADSGALGKITTNLQEISYDKDNGKNIYNNAKVLIETYNNTVGSAGKTESSELERHMKKMKQFLKDNREAFESIGIKITSTGKMELDKEKMLETSSAKMEKILSGDLSKSLGKYAKKINTVAQKLLREEAAKASLKKSQANLSPNASFGTAGMSTSPNSVDVRA